MPASGAFHKKIPFTEWASLHSNLIWVYDGVVEECWRHGVYSSPHPSALLVRRGSFEIKVGEKRIKASAGQWLFPPCGEYWRECSDDTHVLSIRFQARWPSGEELFQEGLGLVLSAIDYPELEKAARPLSRFIGKKYPKAFRYYLMDEPATLGDHLRLQLLFTTWLEAVADALTRQNLVPTRMGRMDPRLLKAVRTMERSVLSVLMPEREIAREAGLSISQFNRLFMKQFGMSPHAYLDRRRESYAVTALQSSSLSIKEIANQLGFSSLPHFSAWFRRHHGLSPREFRSRPTRGAEVQSGLKLQSAKS